LVIGHFCCSQQIITNTFNWRRWKTPTIKEMVSHSNNICLQHLVVSGHSLIYRDVAANID
jgi:hypothetical protein